MSGSRLDRSQRETRSSDHVVCGTRMRRALALLALLAGTVGTLGRPAIRAAAGSAVPGESRFGRNGYVEYIAGDLPIILSAPHGGSLKPAEMPDRTWGLLDDDRLSLEYTLEVAAAITQLTGRHPHVILNHLARAKMDANRDLPEAARGQPGAEQAWTEYQGFLTEAEAAVVAGCGRGHYFDMHSNGRAGYRVELGFEVDAEALALSDADLDDSGAASRSSVQGLASETGSLSAIVRGEGSLGGLLAARGYHVIPSPAAPVPDLMPYFDGGYSVDRYGSRRGGWIDATQIEVSYELLDPALRPRFVDALAESILEFVDQQYGFRLTGSGEAEICPSFVDVAFTHPAYEAVASLDASGRLTACGQSPRRFCPEAPLARAEALVWIETLLHGPEFAPNPPALPFFLDVPAGYWAEGYIASAAEEGLALSCYGIAQAFCPDSPLSRGDAAELILRLAHGKDAAPSPASGVFDDVALGDARAPWIETAYEAGLIDACSANPGQRFCPDAPLTRAQAAVSIARAGVIAATRRVGGGWD